MATSFSHFLSFLLPTRPPPPKSSQFPPLPNHTPAQSPSSSTSLSLSHERSHNQHPVAKKNTDDFDACSSSSSELTSVIFPSLAHANTLYFRSAYNVQVVVEDNEPEERLLNRFRREVMRAGVIQEVKRRRFFENKQDEKKRRTRDAAKRNSRRRRLPFKSGPGGSSQFRPESANAPKVEEDEDNWEMPDENGPASPF